MVLIITNKADPHADVVLEKLEGRGVRVIRFNTEDFPRDIACTWKIGSEGVDGSLEFPLNRQVWLSQVKSCWYRRPDTLVIDSKISQVEARKLALEESETFLKNLWVYLSDRFWIGYPHKLRQAESKIFNLKLASELGFYIPKTLVTNQPEEAKRFFEECQGNLINKVLGRGQVEYFKDYFFVYTHRITAGDLDHLNEIAYAPCLFQEYIPKRIEIRVTVVGSRVFACEIHSQENQRTVDDWRHYNFDDLKDVKHLVHELPLEIQDKCLRMVNHFGLNFATFDLVLTPDGKYVFLEMNPNGQWLWIEDLTGLPISEAITDLLFIHDK